MQAGAAPLATAIAFYYGLAIALFLSVPHIALPSPLSRSLFLLHPFRPCFVMSFFIVADLQVETKELARCLSSLHRFMTAAETLLNSIRALSRYKFRQQSAKVRVSPLFLQSHRQFISSFSDCHTDRGNLFYHLPVIALRAHIYPLRLFPLKIARATLLKMDIKLYTFSPCTSQLRPYKTIYLDILRALKERQNDVSDSIRKGNSTHFQCPHYSRSTTSLIHLRRSHRHSIAALLFVASGQQWR